MTLQVGEKERAEVKKVVIYKANCTTYANCNNQQGPPAACKDASPGSVNRGVLKANKCNVYGRSMFDWGNPKISASDNGSGWPVEDRVLGSDYLGVWVLVENTPMLNWVEAPEEYADFFVVRLNPKLELNNGQTFGLNYPGTSAAQGTECWGGSCGDTEQGYGAGDVNHGEPSMMRSLRRLKERNQHGYIVAFASLAMIGVIGMLAFAVDVGSWYLTASKLQRSADSAALAGATALPKPVDADDAMTVAYRKNTMQDAGNIEIKNVIVSDNEVRTTVTNKKVKVYFAGLFLKKITISRSSERRSRRLRSQRSVARTMFLVVAISICPVGDPSKTIGWPLMEIAVPKKTATSSTLSGTTTKDHSPA